MSSNENSPDGYQSYLEKLWKDRINLPKQADAHSEFGTKVSLLKYTLAEGESEKARLLALLEEEGGELARLEAEAEQEQSIRQAVQARLSMLEDTLTKNLRKPWLPVRDALVRRLSYWAAGLVEPVSEGRAVRFRNSANKRNPRRYMSSDRVDQTAPTVDDNLPIDEYSRQTRTILKRYFPSDLVKPPTPLHMQVGSGALVRNRLKAAPKSRALPQSGALAFSIVTPFFAHIGFFSDCAKSIAALATKTVQPFEWVIVNDDPSIASDSLLNSIPNAIRDRARVMSDGKNHGITRALDRGISATLNNWIVLLDCDDMLESHALEALSSAIEETPECRYFSSLMIDIDDRGKELRRRRAEHELADAFEAGMVGGHMIAFRRDLYEELGGFDPRFSGVQDYDFLLRAAAREQIRRIPQHLYRYRWHSNTQSISRIARQEQLANAVRTAFLNETMGLVAKRVMRSALPDRPEIFCVMRTQGNRIDLLAAALESVRAQALPTTPCIVVHGDRETAEFVRQQLPAELSEGHGDRPAIILQAGELDRRRGYPCNVALDYLKANASRYDMLCFLDDDDHFLPNFAERLTRLIKLTGVDMAYGMANALPKNGEPYVQHEPRPWQSILVGNFITFNGFLVRVDAVLEAGATFAEDMHYLEDHDFLVQLLGAGVRAVPLTEVVSEYRLIGDGNAWDKQDPKHFRSCTRKVRQRAEEAARTLSKDTFWADILAFPAQDRSAFDEFEIGLLLRSRDMLK